jgi:hypothetical protein
MSTHLDPALFPNALLMDACDIPVGMTIGEWRRQCRAAGARPRRRLLFWRAR